MTKGVKWQIIPFSGLERVLVDSLAPSQESGNRAINISREIRMQIVYKLNGF